MNDRVGQIRNICFLVRKKGQRGAHKRREFLRLTSTGKRWAKAGWVHYARKLQKRPKERNCKKNRPFAPNRLWMIVFEMNGLMRMKERKGQGRHHDRIQADDESGGKSGRSHWRWLNSRHHRIQREKNMLRQGDCQKSLNARNTIYNGPRDRHPRH